MEEKKLYIKHRDGLKKRFIENGLDGFFDRHVLEMMLFYCISGEKVNSTAHILLDKFGSLSSIFDASVDSLLECGIDYKTAVFIKLIPSMCSRYYRDVCRMKDEEGKSMEEFILPYFIGQNMEQLLLVLIDAKGKKIFAQIVSKGSRSGADVNMQKIVQLGIEYGASHAVIAHNHPSGSYLPSSQDIDMTSKLKNALKDVDITLDDHYIITGMECHSIFRMEKYKRLFRLE